MRERFSFLAMYFGFWLVFFVFAKLVFLTYHNVDIRGLLVMDLWGIFVNGLLMDLSMVGYICVFPFFLVTFSPFIKKSWVENALYTYTFIFVFIVSLIIVIDLEVYNIWKFRMDVTPLDYLKSPKEAFVSVKSSPVFRLFLSFLALIIVASYLVYRIMSRYLNRWKSMETLPFLPIAFILTCLLLLPIRGGIGGATTMNHSRVYFSENNFANIAAINPTWNFFSSLYKNNSAKLHPYGYSPRMVVAKTIDSLFDGSTETPAINLLSPTVKKTNVLLIIWESFSSKGLDKSIDNQEVMPFINRLKKESVYFSNFYANGERTDKGLLSILSGYPSQPTTSIINDPRKSIKLPVLSQNFEENGYLSEFYYGGDSEFANMKSYLFQANFRKIISEKDFAETTVRSDWGIYDKDLFDKFIADHKETSAPFFSTLLTLSSHEPFDVPLKKFVSDDPTVKYFNSLSYTDDELGKFLEKAKKEKWWQNTLVIIVADHGKTKPETGKRIDDFKIPMIWTGGVITKPKVENRVFSQLDIPATLLSQLGMKSSNYVWSKNSFAKKVKPWAFFVFNDGFGYVENNRHVLFDNKTKKIIEQKGDKIEAALLKGKVLQQATYDDFVHK